MYIYIYMYLYIETNCLFQRSEFNHDVRLRLDCLLSSLTEINPIILQDEPTQKPHHIDERPVWDWNTTHVSQWLMANNLAQYINDFSANSINGQGLLQLDGARLKVSSQRSITFVEKSEGC